ncbi:MAG: M23 family metallopeptidase [Bacteroidetes bacterium]|nr:M23 family metallopeptidase [Bacteroidota bacterium]
MKRFLLFLLSIPALCPAQFISQPAGSAYTFQSGECISDAQRAQIRTLLDSSRQQLIAQGRLSSVHSAQQVALNWPLRFRSGITEYNFYSISGGVDHNPQFPNQLLDYNCGSLTYDTQSGYNHAGTDYFLWPFAFNKMDSSEVEIVAAAAGTIIYKSDGNFDRSCAFNSNNWNAVYVQHSDGSVAWYGHMKNGSLTTKTVGQSVVQGEYLGVVGSSGNSSGPHLHLEIYDAANNLIDPYAGPCNSLNTTSWWASQEPYFNGGINHIATNSQPPVFNACPGTDIRNERDYFLGTDTIYLMLYYRFLETGDNTTYTIYRPNNTVWGTWPSTHNGPDYTAAWYYYWIIPGVGAPNGQWKFEATYNNQTYYTYFYLGTTAAEQMQATPPAARVWYNQAATTLQLASTQQGILYVFDAAGNRVKETVVQDANEAVWCGDLAAGLYIYHFAGDNGASVAGKMVVSAN